jgi:hypothetical protein
MALQTELRELELFLMAWAHYKSLRISGSAFFIQNLNSGLEQSPSKCIYLSFSLCDWDSNGFIDLFQWKICAKTRG